MSQDQITGIVRAVTPGIAAALSHYLLDDATWTVVITSISTVGVAVWSFYTNEPGKVIK